MRCPGQDIDPQGLDLFKGKRLEDYGFDRDQGCFSHHQQTAKAAGRDQAGEIKVTELDLELKGTVVGDGKDSYAFIMERGSKKREVY